LGLAKDGKIVSPGMIDYISKTVEENFSIIAVDPKNGKIAGEDIDIHFIITKMQV